MSTHLYNFDGDIYIQLSGGPIGLRLTAALANLMMAYFDQTLDKLLSREGIVANLKFRFVDDARLWMHPTRAGWRWKDGGMVYNREWVEEDIAAGE